MSGKTINLLTPYFDKNKIPLEEYPRPHFVRDGYMSLNGLWDYAITSANNVESYDGQILVPFSPESILSGVNRHLKKGEFLHYRRMVSVPKKFLDNRLILHFCAVDQVCEVYINHKLVGVNNVAYVPFSFDITDFIDDNTFLIEVKVQDATSEGNNLIGKQKEKRGGIWYTPQSGIWQSVWLESLPEKHIKSVSFIADVYQKDLTVILDKSHPGDVEIQVYFEGQLVAKRTSDEDKVKIQVGFPQLWAPDHPHLYDVYLTFNDDKVKSYFAFRKVEKCIEKDGIARFYLNNEPIFQSGVLDQGYYSDGLLTPPSDEAMINDIKLLKEMGFNMLRKHIKIEPLRFYYHCDRLGIMVWQDMINLVPHPKFNTYALNAMFLEMHPNDENTDKFGVNHQKQQDNYYQGLRTMIETLKVFPSIVTWVPFNEGWGQFNSKKAVDIIKEIDNTRLNDHASGWSDQGVGDFYSRHIYFTKLRVRPKLFRGRIVAITEFGGYSYREKGHVFNSKKTFGYRVYITKNSLENAFRKLYIRQVKPLIKKGLSVIIYTQLSDVEDEVNGLITYDRQVVKFDKEKVKELNHDLYQTFRRSLFDH